MFVAQTLLITDITTIHFQLQGCVVLSKPCLSPDVYLYYCVSVSQHWTYWVAVGGYLDIYH